MISVISEKEVVSFENEGQFIMFTHELFNDNNHWLTMQKPNDVDSCKEYVRNVSTEYKLLRLSF